MKRILFLCVANSARSQMAEGLARFRALLQERFAIEHVTVQPEEANAAVPLRDLSRPDP